MGTLIGESFISGFHEGEKFFAEIENSNHIYLETETLFNHTHNGIDSSDLVSGIATGSTYIDDICVSEHPSLFDLVNGWDSGWIEISPGKHEFYHGLSKVPSIQHLYHSRESDGLSGATEHFDEWRKEGSHDLRHVESHIINCDKDVVTVYYGDIRCMENKPSTSIGGIDSDPQTDVGDGYCRIVLVE